MAMAMVPITPVLISFGDSTHPLCVFTFLAAFFASIRRTFHYCTVECAVISRIHESDLPGDAKLSVVEVLLYGWVSTALRLEGGKQRWLLHGIVGYLLTQFAAEFRGEEEKQHRLWRAMQKAVSEELHFEASQ